jgi:hypothetical protein
VGSPDKAKVLTSPDKLLTNILLNKLVILNLISFPLEFFGEETLNFWVL